MFRREAGLIRLRNKDSKGALSELSKARKLFGAGGNREGSYPHRLHTPPWTWAM